MITEFFFQMRRAHATLIGIRTTNRKKKLKIAVISMMSSVWSGGWRTTAPGCAAASASCASAVESERGDARAGREHALVQEIAVQLRNGHLEEQLVPVRVHPHANEGGALLEVRDGKRKRVNGGRGGEQDQREERADQRTHRAADWSEEE
jgi:hypothetical protein